MPRFMERRNFLFFFADNAAFLLCADSHFYKRLTDIALYDICPVCLCRIDRRFVQQILQICAGKSRRRLRDLL